MVEYPDTTHPDSAFDARPRVRNSGLNILPENPDKQAKGRFPAWLHRKLPSSGEFFNTNALVHETGLNTVCEEAKCPNRLECYSKKTATFLVLGKECTRNCGFCDIDFSKTPKAPAADEPARVAESTKRLGLRHVVITMVARDDLPDGGAAHLVEIIRVTRRENPGITVELLTSDFAGNFEALDLVLAEEPEIFNYNVETVRALTPKVRHKATYDRTLQVLAHVKQSGRAQFVKSGMMLGFGETHEQVHETIRDLHAVGCDIITIGQYLQASRSKLLVKEFVTPEQFKAYEAYGYEVGVPHIYAGPFVRSSYNASLVKDLVVKGASK